ncbi:XrtA/PEP-CTERM system TPR-repeat protein PrsT [Roseateles sp. LYH14W]|uniref:XrtA/PEP-CTERM system TPR-repeat protein PrsT n=1 Tax=Pelomonas parva TaxID=3299032 RepID=A0ABW7F3G8_9BURK
MTKFNGLTGQSARTHFSPRLAGLLCALLVAGTMSPVSAQTSREKAARYYEDAQVRFDRKDVSGAIVQLKNALQIDKTLLPVQLLLGRALMMDGQVAAAEVAIAEALRLGVDRAEVAVILGQALLAQGKHQQLLEQARMAPAGLPNSVRLAVLLQRATAYADLGSQANALQSIEEARAIDRNAPETWLAEVPVRVRARQFKEATLAADTALKLSPNLAEAHYQRASISHLSGDIAAAIAGYSEALKLDTRHIESRLARAGLYIDSHRDADALADVEAARKQLLREPRAAYLKALLSSRAGDRVAAKAALQEVVALLDPVPIEFIRYRPQLLLLAGMAHYELDELGKAKPFLELFCRAQPMTPASKMLARISLQENNPDQAIEVLESYLKLVSNDGQALTMLSAAYLGKGRHHKASQLMEEALKTRDRPEFHTALGMALYQGGDSSSARAQLLTAFKKDPRQVQAGMGLIALYLRENLPAKAVEVADALLKQQAGNAVFLNLAGVARAKAGDFGTARRHFEAAYAADPKLIAPQLGLARLDIAANAYESASRRLKAILKLDERNTEAMFDQAVLQQRMGKLDEAQRLLENVAQLSAKTDTRADFALVEMHLKLNRPSQAMEAAKSLLAKAPDDVGILSIYARAQLANGNASGARHTLVNASRRAGSNAQIQTDIAAMQVTAGDLAAANYSLDKALGSSPDFLPANVLMATIDLQRNESAMAEARAKRIIQQHPKLPVGHQLLGDIAAARGQPAAAIAAYRQAFSVQPTSTTLRPLFELLSAKGQPGEARAAAEAWLKRNPRDLNIRKALANHHARNADFARSKAEYEAVLKIADADAEALNNLSNVHLALKNPKAAIQTAEKALLIRPNNALITDTLGWALFEDGQTDAALIKLRDARLRAPNNPDIRYHLAAVLAKVGKRTEAREELTAAIRDYPSFESREAAKRLLDALK